METPKTDKEMKHLRTMDALTWKTRTRTRVESRDDGSETEVEERVIEGYAAKFGEITDLGYFTEEIAVGAFEGRLDDDVRCLLNHDANYVLARSRNGKGTLEMFVDDIGLGMRFVPGSQTYAQDLLETLDREDITQMSFAFTIESETWEYDEEEGYHRIINKIGRLFDVAIVTYPAYEGTEVSARTASEEDIPEDIRKQAITGDYETELDHERRRIDLLKIKYTK